MAKKQTSKDSDSPLPFEESLGELQQIVTELEDGSIGLEESMERFEQGTGLLKHCYQILESAEQKIEILTGIDSDGNPITAPFDGSATADVSGKTAGRRKKKKSAPSTPDESSDEESDDDGMLF